MPGRGRGLRAAERKLGLLGDIASAGAGSNIAKGSAAGLLGTAGDIQSIAGLVADNAPFLPASAKVAMRGLLGGAFGGRQLPTSDELARQFGADLSRPSTQVGLIGAPDPGDMARIGTKGLLAQALFHGTPHKFERFDLGKIGTGEGAQAFGHGLYFAENPGVAKTYKSGLSRKQVQRNFLDALPEDADFDEVTELLGTGHFTPDQERVIRALEKDDWLGFDYPSQAISSAYGKQLSNFDPSDELKKAVEEAGHLYEVEIPDEVTAKMLDWDKPLSEQPEILDAIESMKLPDGEAGLVLSNAARQARAGDKGITGQTLYNLTGRAFGEGHQSLRMQNSLGDVAASRVLNEAGIPGIRYFDGGSRKAGDGTRNIVLFDPDLITEVKRDGEKVFSK